MTIKNIALAGHAGTGKTTLMEALLYQGGCTERMGSVAAGTTVSDYTPEEIKRHSSVCTATGSIQLDGLKVNLLDTPGILWPKFEDEKTGMSLAFTGAVKDDIMDVEALGCHLMALLSQRYPQSLMDGYKLPQLPQRQEEENDVAYGYRLLETCAQKRGMRISGGEFDTERMARTLLDEYRGSKLGRFTLEVPDET